jgi:hypothetical protein
MKKNFKTALAIIALCISFLGQSQTSKEAKPKPSIGINPALSFKMLEPTQDLRKVQILIEGQTSGNLVERKLLVGGSIIVIGDYQKSNTDSKFGYLMRHPTSSNQIGFEVSEVVVHSFQLSLTGAINKWIAMYGEMLYNPMQSFGTGLITDIERNQIQLSKGFVLFGNLNKFPVYGAMGKMDSPFGQTGSVSPFTNSTMWHAFGGIGYGAQIGFKKWNLHAVFMAVQGGAQFRAMNTIVGDSTNVPSKLNNFVADLNYTIHFAEYAHLVFGASYLHGSNYNQAFPVIHFDPGVINNPASSIYARLLLGQKILVMSSYAITAKTWPGTHNPSAPLDIYPASKASSLNAGLKYTFNPNSKIIYTVSGEFSNFRAGPEGSPWERQNQYILGFSGLINQSSKIFVEFFRTEGYVPLNFISGSNPNAPFPEGTTHSVHDATSMGFVVGAQITF